MSPEAPKPNWLSLEELCVPLAWFGEAEPLVPEPGVSSLGTSPASVLPATEMTQATMFAPVAGGVDAGRHDDVVAGGDRAGRAARAVRVADERVDGVRDVRDRGRHADADLRGRDDRAREVERHELAVGEDADVVARGDRGAVVDPGLRDAVGVVEVDRAVERELVGLAAGLGDDQRPGERVGGDLDVAAGRHRRAVVDVRRRGVALGELLEGAAERDRAGDRAGADVGDAEQREHADDVDGLDARERLDDDVLRRVR